MINKPIVELKMQLDYIQKELIHLREQTENLEDLLEAYVDAIQVLEGRNE